MSTLNQRRTFLPFWALVLLNGGAGLLASACGSSTDNLETSDSQDNTETQQPSDTEGDTEGDTDFPETTDNDDSSQGTGTTESSTASNTDAESTASDTNDTESESESDTEVDCDLPQWEDDIQVDMDAAATFEFRAERLAMDEEEQIAFVCGQGHVAAQTFEDTNGVLPKASIQGQVLPWPALGNGATCKAIHNLGQGRVLVLSSNGTLGLIARDDTGTLSETAAMMVSAPRIAADPIHVLHASTTVTSPAFQDPVYDFAVFENRIWIALGNKGVVEIEINEDTFVEKNRWTEDTAIGTRGIAFLPDGHLVTANDTDSIYLLDLSGQVIHHIKRDRPGGATRVLSDGHSKVAVLRGGKGLEIFERQNQSLISLGRALPLGTTGDLRFLDDGILIATGSELARYTYDPNDSAEIPQLNLVSTQRRLDTPRNNQYGKTTNDGLDRPWFRALSHRGPLFALSQHQLMPLEIGDGLPAPNLWFDRGTYSTATRPDLPKSTVIVSCANRGKSPLIVKDLQVTAPFEANWPDSIAPREGCEGQFIIEPRGNCYIVVTFEPEADDKHTHTQFIEFQSSDPNQNNVKVRVEGNRKAPPIGSEAIDVPMLTQTGRMFSIEDYQGSHLLMKVFNTE